MAEFINKDALVAKIRRWLGETDKGFPNEHNLGRFDAYKRTLSFLDTLEVKEVDLKKEFNNYAKNILACDVQFEPFTHLYNCAKYFYKLGLAQKGE